MGDERRHNCWELKRRHVTDGCLLATLLLVLAMAWQGPSRNTSGDLTQAAREVVARQVGAAPANQALSAVVTNKSIDESAQAQVGVTFLRGVSNTSERNNDARI
jgi:hypothetical protein